MRNSIQLEYACRIASEVTVAWLLCTKHRADEAIHGAGRRGIQTVWAADQSQQTLRHNQVVRSVLLLSPSFWLIIVSWCVGSLAEVACTSWSALSLRFLSTRMLVLFCIRPTLNEVLVPRILLHFFFDLVRVIFQLGRRPLEQWLWRRWP